jgi:hypothetical protein
MVLYQGTALQAAEKAPALYQGTALQVAEKLRFCIKARLYRLRNKLRLCIRARLCGKSSGFVSGHGFSRAAKRRNFHGL